MVGVKPKPRVWTPLLAAAEMAHLDTLQVLLDVTLIAIKKFEKESVVFSCSSSCFLFCSLSMFSWFLFCIVLMMAAMVSMVVADNYGCARF